MPLRFRCGYCNRLLGIARRKAGSNTTCPHCGATIAVPTPEEYEESPQAAPDLEEIDELLKPEHAVATATPPPRPAAAENAAHASTPPASTTPPAALPPVARSREVVEPLPLPEDDVPPAPRQLDAVARPAGEEARSAMSPGEPTPAPEVTRYILTVPQVRGLAAAILVVIALAFAAGYMIASR